MTPTDYLLGVLAATGSHIDSLGGGTWKAQCPAHADASPSLWVKAHATADGTATVLVFCHAGCPLDAVLHAVGLTKRSLFRVESLPEPVAVAAALTERGRCPVYPAVRASRSVRHGPGGCPWPVVGEHRFGDRWMLRRHRDPVSGAKDVSWLTCVDGRWVPGRKDTPDGGLPLYRCDEVQASRGLVLVVESESSCDSAWAAGLAATTWAGGASVVRGYLPSLCGLLAGRDVLLVPDNDQPGRTCTEALRAALTGVAASVRVVDPVDVVPDCPKGCDARDLIDTFGVEVLTGEPAPAEGSVHSVQPVEVCVDEVATLDGAGSVHSVQPVPGFNPWDETGPGFDPWMNPERPAGCDFPGCVEQRVVGGVSCFDHIGVRRPPVDRPVGVAHVVRGAGGSGECRTCGKPTPAPALAANGGDCDYCTPSHDCGDCGHGLNAHDDGVTVRPCTLCGCAAFTTARRGA